MKKWIVIAIEILILSSTGFLIYMAITKNFHFGFRFRFSVFAFQHIFSFLILIYGFCFEHHNFLQNLNWITLMNFGNFLIFGTAQIYLATVPNTKINFSDKHMLYGDFGIAAYIHLYYQVNIYFGIFSVFSVLFCVVYRIYEQRHLEKMEEVISNLDNNIQYSSGEEEPCSICLMEYEKGEQYYILYCRHMFHKECIKNWFNESLTCPLCRGTILYEGQQ